MDVRELLATAARAGEVVRLTYNGGSRPGAVREVVVLAIDGHRVVCAELPGRARKTFDIAKIAAVALSDGRAGTQAGASPAPEPSELPAGCSTFQDYAAALRDEFAAAGWNVEVTPTSMSVGRFYKNGKPRKSFAFSIYFADPAAPRWVWDEESNERVLVSAPTGRERPWSLRGETDLGGSHKDMEPALRRFVEAVRGGNPAG